MINSERPAVSGKKSQYFIYGLGLVAMLDDAGESFSYHYDFRANTRLLTDSFGML